MLNRRTVNSKTWMNFDGSYTTEIHSGIVHYVDENGNLQNINTDLYDEADFDQIDFPVAKDGDSLFYEAKARAADDKKKNRLDRDKFDFQGLKVPFDCKIPRNIKRGYSIGKGKSKLSFIPVGASSSKGYVEGNKITYPDVWPDTDVVLEMLPTGIKETIILKTNKTPFDFSFEVQGNLEGEMKIQPPWLQDAEGTKRDVVQGVSDVDGKVLLNLAADASGLVYPIEVDPTVTIQPNGTAGKDTFVSSQDASSNFGTFTTLHVLNATYKRHALLEFDLSSIPSDSQIQEANLILYFIDITESGSKDFVLKPITSSWSETGVTWSTKPSVSSVVSDLTNVYVNTTGLKTFKATNSVQYSVANTNYGLELSLISTTNSQKEFVSSDDVTTSRHPKLTVTYNQPPTAPTVTAPNGGETWNSLHTVEWLPSVDQDPVSFIQTTSETGQILVNNVGTSPKGQSFNVNSDGYITEIEFYARGAVSQSMIGGLCNVDSYGRYTSELTSQVFTIPDTYGYVKLTLPQPYKVTKGQYIGAYMKVNGSGSNFYLGGAGTNVYTEGNAFEGGTNHTDKDCYLKISIEGTPQNQLQYQIQLSPDNGSIWKDIVSLTPSGATSANYDFINEPETSLAKVRIRAYDGYIYGPWDESDGVFTIQHNQAPTAPTNLSPSSGTRDRAAVNRLSWQHNDANADPQAKFDLQWRVQGAATWNEVTQSTVNQYYDVPANLFPRGTVEWRVRTYDQADLSSPFSVIATFFAGDKPAAPIIVSPGSAVAVANPTVQWSSTGQTGFSLTVKNSTGTTVFYVERNSTNKAETITYSLENQQDYTIELRIKNADGLYSDAAILNITVSYTPPAIPDIETVKGNSYVQINITDPAPTGTQPAVIFHEVYKEINNEFVLIATNVQNEFKDYHTASGEVTRYFVRTQGDNETFSDTITFSESITLKGVWLHVVENPESSVYNFKLDGGGRSSKWGLESAIHHFQGRKRPVIETGEMEEFSIDFSLQIENDPERIALENIVYSQETVCYRDGRGRKAFGIFVDVPLNDESWKGYSTSLTLMKIDFREGIE